MSRVTRKDEHIFTALKLANHRGIAGFNDITFVHNALPEISGSDITLLTNLFHKDLTAPLIINAITGGGSVPGKINQALAVAARETGVAMAVGSQTVAMENPEYKNSFRIVRKVNPKGLVLANVGANSPLEYALKAIDMIDADALQVHLNVPQETVMKDGDRDFRGVTDNIAKIAQGVGVPVIIKEVGFGLSREIVFKLSKVGIKNYDVGGSGGTNFISIEGMRGDRSLNYLESWGIPTAVSLAEIITSGLSTVTIATGGIKNALDWAKALAMGADAAGIAGVYLKVLFQQNLEGLISSINNMKTDLTKIMLILGIKSPQMLRTVPIVITGKTREWLTERGVDTAQFARRNWQVTVKD